MTLLNVLIPYLFFEIFSILLAFIFVVIIETLIINKYLKIGLVKTFKVCYEANFLTTIIGYFLQGLLRIIIGYTIISFSDKLEDNSIFRGLFGNVGIAQEVYKDINIVVLTTIITSTVLALIISILFENYYFKISLKSQVDKNLISKPVIIANLLSYIILAIWIYVNYQLYLEQ